MMNTMVMTNLITQAITGSAEPRALLQQAGIAGLRAQAGYVADSGVFADEPQADFIVYEYTGYSAETFHTLSRFVKGHGWIAGGSVLHFVHAEKIGYNDVDVFCVSQDAYQFLRARLHGNIMADNQRSCTIENAYFSELINQGCTFPRCINLVAPLDNQDWSHPANVLQEFDLSVAAVAVIEPGLAYTLHKADVLKKEISYIGNCRNPVRFWRRVMKYYNRGCLLSMDFFADLMKDERTRELVYMAQDIYDMNSRKEKIDSEFLWACWAINDYEGNSETGDSTDNDDYEQGWY